jgi:hypothetical protein
MLDTPQLTQTADKLTAVIRSPFRARRSGMSWVRASES